MHVGHDKDARLLVMENTVLNFRLRTNGDFGVGHPVDVDNLDLTGICRGLGD